MRLSARIVLASALLAAQPAWAGCDRPAPLRFPAGAFATDLSGGVARGERYLPEEIAEARFYEPSERGYEKTIAERLRRIRGDGEPQG